jgi:nucleotide sugar dehydrogenase
MTMITVVAMGKIGLPLAVQFASMGHKVIGTDVNGNTIKLINDGLEPFPGEAYLQEKLVQVVASGNLVATSDTTGSVEKSEVVVVVVPLFVDAYGVPDFGWMDDATISIGKGLKKGTLVLYETTLPVGTTRNRFAKILEVESGLTAGVDFYLAFSPERVFTGRVFEDLRKYPKLVGGLDEVSGQKAKEFYESVLEFDYRNDLPKENGVWDLGSCEASELAKLAETTYRDVNIGLANQFALFADKNQIDIYKVIEACNSQPYSHIHQPGIAVGGHCIPIYPRMYLWNDPSASIVQAARDANSNMPNYAVNLLEKYHGSLAGESVVVLGASYRGGVKETAFSGVFSIVEELIKKGAVPLVNDPLFTHEELIALKLVPYDFGMLADAAIIQANHVEYYSIKSHDLPGVRTVLDGRKFLKPNQLDGVNVVVLGADK